MRILNLFFEKTVVVLFVFASLFVENLSGEDASLPEKPFVFVIPSYNNKEWYQKNLNSIFNQKYDNYRVIYISDGSTDGTDQLVDNYIRKHQQGNRFTHIKNPQRNGPLSCICRAIFSCDKREIIIDLDGNDWLAHDKVLSSLNEIYANPDVWMTYGQFIYFPEFVRGFAAQVPQDVIDKNSFRSFHGAVTHLKTFYAGLFQEIDKEDFLYDGGFFQEAYDLAYSIPLTELAGSHIKFVPQVLYIYNHSFPLNENKKPSFLERELDHFIRSKKKYSPLKQLPFSNEGNCLPSDSVYNQIKDLLHPSFNDYRLIQDFLSHGERNHLERLRDMELRMRTIKLIGDTPEEFPQSGSIAVNCDPDDKENCLLIYSSFNLNYPKGLKRLLKLVIDSDFRGHVLYQLGGWPNAEGGSLILSHVPYAFKASFFKEAQRKGFKRVLWLDTVVVPLVSLNDLFAMIAEKGYFVMGNDHQIGPYMVPQAAVYFGLTHQQTFQIPSCSAGLFGVDFNNETGRKIVDLWYQAAHDKDAFFSARSDQNALSTILYQMNITDFMSLDRMAFSKEEIKSDTVFWHDRGCGSY